MFVIAENLNSSDPAVHAALAAGERRWVEERARALAARGCDAIDINAGTFGSSEFEVLAWMAEIVEAAVELPLCLDTARPELLARVAERRRLPPILNSFDVDTVLASGVPAAMQREGCQLIVQLRRGRSLPRMHGDRLAWTHAALTHLTERGLGIDRILVDAVMLPWGTDIEAGRGLVDFVGEIGDAWPGLRTLVGLSNVSYGHPGPSAMHAIWLDRLQRLGLGAVLLDGLDPTCMAIARR